MDYIFHNNAEDPNEFDSTLVKNKDKVKLKNAIMQVWMKVKEET